PPPQPCGDCYQGIGEGNSYQAAKSDARADLCSNIRVVVSSLIETGAYHSVKKSPQSNDFKVNYKEVAKILTKSKSNCVFEQMPVRETKSEQSGGRYYVLLTMKISDYAHYMAGRYAAIEFQPGSAAEKQLFEPLIEFLRGRGYLPLGEDKTSPDYRLIVKYSQNVKNTGVEGLQIGEASLSGQIVRLADGAVVETLQVNGLVERGFSIEKIENELLIKASLKILEKAEHGYE
ncbi:MAG: LPP20 family lipoprotein, partial [Deltaproteobacteria bacterium]|nr:LPP20 family lipoprotein [Deltaproteobacteria bacterium]